LNSVFVLLYLEDGEERGVVVGGEKNSNE